MKDKVILYTKGNLFMDLSIEEFFQKVAKALKALENILEKPMDEDRFNGYFLKRFCT